MTRLLFAYVVCYPASSKMLNKLCLISVPSKKGAVFCSASRRHFSDELRTIKNIDTAHFRRGTGGRSSFNGNVVTVFGATGFMGRYICNQLGKRGCQLIIPHRCDADEPALKSLKLCGDLGQVLFYPFDLGNPQSIRQSIKYSNVVINLIGRNFETPNYSFHKVHVKGAKDIAQACRELNIERLIHISDLNVTNNPKKYYLMKYNYLPSKLQGEEAVFEEFPAATVFRPASVYGTFDNFLWPLCTNLRTKSLSIPLYAKGEKTIKQPLYVSDFAQGLVSAMNDYSTRGKIYQAVGPERYLLKDIAIFCAQTLQRHVCTEKLVHDIKYDFMYPCKVLMYRYILEFFQSSPVRNMAFEYIERESVTDVVDHNLPTLIDLGIPLSKFEDKVPNMIFNLFKSNPGMIREHENFLPVENLSPKAVNDYALN